MSWISVPYETQQDD